jgi:predicted hotdog family 3-hydroxylacyl-ACP dehydratase
MVSTSLAEASFVEFLAQVFESALGLEEHRKDREDARTTLLLHIRDGFLQVCSFGVAYIRKRDDEN